jgi:hypothetical protein
MRLRNILMDVPFESTPAEMDRVSKEMPLGTESSKTGIDPFGSQSLGRVVPVHTMRTGV